MFASGVHDILVVRGGMIYVLVDASSVGLRIENSQGAKLVEYGERIKAAVQKHTNPIHPENEEIQGVSVLQFTEPVQVVGGIKQAKNTVVVSPGRLDRSPCGTGTCARLAVLHKRGQLQVGEELRHSSVIGTEFVARISDTARVGQYNAVRPIVRGSAWITAYKQMVLDPSDPFPQGFRVGDVWQMGTSKETTNGH